MPPRRGMRGRRAARQTRATPANQAFPASPFLPALPFPQVPPPPGAPPARLCIGIDVGPLGDALLGSGATRQYCVAGPPAASAARLAAAALPGCTLVSGAARSLGAPHLLAALEAVPEEPVDKPVKAGGVAGGAAAAVAPPTPASARLTARGSTLLSVPQFAERGDEASFRDAWSASRRVTDGAVAVAAAAVAAARARGALAAPAPASWASVADAAFLAVMTALLAAVKPAAGTREGVAAGVRIARSAALLLAARSATTSAAGPLLLASLAAGNLGTTRRAADAVVLALAVVLPPAGASFARARSPRWPRAPSPASCCPPPSAWPLKGERAPRTWTPPRPPWRAGRAAGARAELIWFVALSCALPPPQAPPAFSPIPSLLHTPRVWRAHDEHTWALPL